MELQKNDTTRGLTEMELEDLALVVILDRAKAEATGYSVPHLLHLETRLRDLAGLPTDDTPAPDAVHRDATKPLPMDLAAAS